MRRSHHLVKSISFSLGPGIRGFGIGLPNLRRASSLLPTIDHFLITPVQLARTSLAVTSIRPKLGFHFRIEAASLGAWNALERHAVFHR